MAGQGTVRLGPARQGVQRTKQNLMKAGTAWPGTARPGMARYGLDWQGKGAYAQNRNEESKMLKEAKDQIKEAVSSLLTLFASHQRGAIVTFEAMEQAIGQRRYEGQWAYIVRKFRRKFLKETGIALRPSIRVGYEILTPKDQLDWCPKNRQKRSRRQLSNCIKEVSGVSDESLTEHQRRTKALLLANVRHERRVISRCLREQKRPTETLPQRKVALGGGLM